MATLYLIDILDDPDHAFTDVFDRFLQRENLNISYYRIDGLHEQVNYEAVLDSDPAGIVISGSLQSVYDQKPWMQKLSLCIREAHRRNIPVIGLCFGHQLIAHAMGGQVEPLKSWEFGVHTVFQQGEHDLLQDLPERFETLQVHQDHVSRLPEGAQNLGFSEQTPHQMFALGSLFGVQFHPEYTVEMLRTIIQHRHQKFVDKGPFTSEAHLNALANRWEVPTLPAKILRRFLLSLPVEAEERDHAV